MAKKKNDEKQDEGSDGTVAVNDAWTGMLAVSLLALVVATGFLTWDYFSFPSEDPKLYKSTTTPPGGPPPKVVIPKGEDKDKDKDKDKDMDKDKDKDADKDKDKDKDKAAQPTDLAPFAVDRQLAAGARIHFNARRLDASPALNRRD